MLTDVTGLLYNLWKTSIVKRLKVAVIEIWISKEQISSTVSFTVETQV